MCRGVRVTSNRKLKVVALGIMVHPDKWNTEKSKVKSTDYEYIFKNHKLDIQYDIAQQIYLDYLKENKPLSLELFAREFKGYDSKTSFYSFVAAEIKHRSFSKETNRTYLSQLSKLKQFSPELNFIQINLDFVESYKKYMIEVLKNKPITFCKSLGMLRTFVNWAKARDLIKGNPFNETKIKKLSGERQYLTLSEVEILEKIYSENGLKPQVQSILAYFLFTCFTGLRFTDVKELRKAAFSSELIKNERVVLLSLEMLKTKRVVTVPILERIKKYYDLTGKLEHERVFKVRSNQYTNRSLKEIIKLSGINKSISFHCARHTFATMSLDVGIPQTTVQSILGHTSIRTTALYAKVSQMNKYNELKKLE